jgi:hypothetical protein
MISFTWQDNGSDDDEDNDAGGVKRLRLDEDANAASI